MSRVASVSAVEPVRRFSCGAEPLSTGGVHFRVWAPTVKSVDVCIEAHADQSPRFFPLEKTDDGYFAGHVAEAETGDLYWFRLAEHERLLPDPASRYQPRGPHGPSQVIDPAAYAWHDEQWRGVELPGQVIYEMHVGTFTPEGTWQAAASQLEELANLGITLIEMMPVADFPGRFGWGYDGVNLFAPSRLYGAPNDLRALVDRAHQLGLGVILDVVYNHLGPDGNFLPQFSESYFSQQHHTDWGPAINFDGAKCEVVREFFTTNAAYWIEEFHFDGLRLDATQDIHDDSPRHILLDITEAVRAAAGQRSVIIVAENEPQHVRLIEPVAQGGYGIDAIWNDDFHHSAMVRLTGRNEAYYSDYLGRPQEFISAAKRGFLFQGQWYCWQEQPRGTSGLNIPPAKFVTFIQNHDQVANTALGQRAHMSTSPGRLRAMTVLWLLSPGTPMFFQGQEFAASSPFFYFADHEPALSEKVNQGRRDFMAQFPSLTLPEVQAQLPDSGGPATFMRCKLDFTERTRNVAMYELHRDLLKLRRDDPVFSAQRPGAVDGAVLGDNALVLRFFGAGHDDRLLLVNFEGDLPLVPMPEPLLAPPPGKVWRQLLSTEELKYGGAGTPPLDTEGAWRIAGQMALVLRADPPTDNSTAGAAE